MIGLQFKNEDCTKETINFRIVEFISNETFGLAQSVVGFDSVHKMVVIAFKGSTNSKVSTHCNVFNDISKKKIFVFIS